MCVYVLSNLVFQAIIKWAVKNEEIRTYIISNNLLKNFSRNGGGILFREKQTKEKRFPAKWTENVHKPS